MALSNLGAVALPSPPSGFEELKTRICKMKADEFEEWYARTGRKGSSKRVAELRNIANNLAELGMPYQDIDEAWEDDRFERLLDRLDELIKDAREGGDDFKILVPGGKRKNAPNSINSYKSLLRRYREVRADAHPIQGTDQSGDKRSDVSSDETDAPSEENGRFGKESPEHIALKNYISENPEIFGFSSGIEGKIEEKLPSGDPLDVSFESRGRWLAVEVKSTRSDNNYQDFERGLYQCVKYRAVMEKFLIVKSKKRKSAEAILVLEGKLPKRLNRVKKILDVEVIEEVRSKK